MNLVQEENQDQMVGQVQGENKVFREELDKLDLRGNVANQVNLDHKDQGVNQVKEEKLELRAQQVREVKLD